MIKQLLWLIRLGSIALVGLLLSVGACQWDTEPGANPLERPYGVATEVAHGYQLISVGKTFPNIALASPERGEDQVYLGIHSDSTFSINDIQADLVLVEILNVHCIHCQNQAPIYNKLFGKIAADASTQNHIKMIGVGAGNSLAELREFRKEYNIQFPLVPDQWLDLHEAIGSPRTPFSVLVRLEKDPDFAITALTYSGVQKDHEDVYEDMKALKSLDLAILRERGLKKEAKFVKVEPPLPRSEILALIKKAMIRLDAGDLEGFEALAIESRQVYSGVFAGEEEKRLFAEVVSRPTLCDICHDVHFAYIFNQKGEVLDFIPLQVTKWGNKEWSGEDVQLMRERLVGRFIFSAFAFNPELDAVSSATITSAVIFEGMSEGTELFDALKEKGLI